MKFLKNIKSKGLSEIVFIAFAVMMIIMTLVAVFM